jgi:hypothetical protein
MRSVNATQTLLKALNRAMRILQVPSGSDSAQHSQQLQSLATEISVQAAFLATMLSCKRHYVTPDVGGPTNGFIIDPRYLVFEFTHDLVLRQSQVALLSTLVTAMGGRTRDTAAQRLEDIEQRSLCHQMIMGAGKTTVIVPMLGLTLAEPHKLIVVCVPPALLDFSRAVLREKFSAVLQRPVFTFEFDRYTPITRELCTKIEIARFSRAAMVTTPTALKSFMLKFLEILHLLDEQKNLSREQLERQQLSRGGMLTAMRGFLKRRKSVKFKFFTEDEVVRLREQADLADKIFQIFDSAVLIMDEVDLILHPLKSM